MSETLWHYTCDHGADSIERDGLVRPGPDGLVWMTDLEAPFREALGLTMVVTACDRAEHRFEVDARTAMWWPTVRRHYPFAQDLDSAPGARPRHWWVATEAVKVVS